MRLAVARLWFEANSFSPVPTELRAFQKREWISGKEAREFYAGTATEMGGVLKFEEQHPDWKIEFLHCCAAPPGGLVSDEAFREIRARILKGLSDGSWDAIYLSLHGAMATTSDPTPELHLLKDIRAKIGTTPLGVSFDLHAHLHSSMIELVDAVSGYHTYPHIDMDRTAERILNILTKRTRGLVKPQIAIAKVPAILPSFNMRTDDGPMAEIQRLADQWREREDVLDVSVFGGFAYGDSPFAGPSVVATTNGDKSLAERIAGELAVELAARRANFDIHLPNAQEGIRLALATPGTKPAIVLDPADNPLSGGIGDTPGLFRGLLEAERPANTVFAFFSDPPLVDHCHRMGAGAAIEARLGGRITDQFGPPVPVTGKILKLTDGKFRNSGAMERNMPVDLGRTVLLEIQGIRVIVTEGCQTPNDPEFFVLHGVDLAKVDLLCVKAKNHFRAGFTPLARCLIDVDEPGPAAASLAHYKFQHVPPHFLVAGKKVGVT